MKMSTASAVVPVGYKQTEVGVIPEDWEIKRLGDLLSVMHGKSQKKVADNSGPYPILGTGGFMGWANQYLYNKPCVLIGRKGSIDKPQYMDTPFWSVDTLFYCVVKADNDARFLYYKFLQINWYDYNEASGVPSLNSSTIEKISIGVPNYNEQRIIAEVLNSSDYYIQTLDNLITKKRDIKQGTMQELLTGKTRLPGFTGKWDVKSLGQVGEISGSGVDKKIIEGETPVRLVNYLDVYNRSFIYSDELDYYVTAPPSKAIKCSVRKGDVFFTPTSEVRDDIAVSAVAMEDIPDGAHSYHIVRLRIRDDWDLNFKAYAFQTKSFLDQAAVLADGSGTRYVISLPNFRKLKVLVPSKLEQQAIGQILSGMDAEISALEKRLEKAKAIKQGMMQQLLTGKIRLVEPQTSQEVSA